MRKNSEVLELVKGKRESEFSWFIRIYRCRLTFENFFPDRVKIVIQGKKAKFYIKRR